jgi:hypothetical protein
MVVLSVAIGWVSALVGHGGAVALDASIAGAMGLVAGFLFTVALLASPKYGLVARALRRRSRRRASACRGTCRRADRVTPSAEPDGTRCRKVRRSTWRRSTRSAIRRPTRRRCRSGPRPTRRSSPSLAWRLRAEETRALLVVLQGMDASGKDGILDTVFGAVNPVVLAVHPFGAPSDEERATTTSGGVHAACPRRGQVGVFNRSHYEDVGVVRVHDWAPGVRWPDRFRQIADFERMLTENGTTIVKLYLHISKDEQKEQLQERLDDPRSTGSSAPATSRSARSGTTTSTPTVRRSRPRRPPGPRGTSCPWIGAGTAGPSRRGSSAARWSGWTRGSRRSRPTRPGCGSSDGAGQAPDVVEPACGSTTTTASGSSARRSQPGVNRARRPPVGG